MTGWISIDTLLCPFTWQDSLDLSIGQLALQDREEVDQPNVIHLLTKADQQTGQSFRPIRPYVSLVLSSEDK